MDTKVRGTPTHQQPIQHQILVEWKEMRRTLDEIATAISKLSHDLPNAMRS